MTRRQWIILALVANEVRGLVTVIMFWPAIKVMFS